MVTISRFLGWLRSHPRWDLFLKPENSDERLIKNKRRLCDPGLVSDHLIPSDIISFGHYYRVTLKLRTFGCSLISTCHRYQHWLLRHSTGTVISIDCSTYSPIHGYRHRLLRLLSPPLIALSVWGARQNALVTQSSP